MVLSGLAWHIATAQSTAPRVVTNTFVARGVTKALARSTVSGGYIREEGYCWSTHPVPTIADQKTTEYYERRGKLFRIEGLQPATVYYMRAYAIGSDSAVGYGDVVKVITLPAGNTAYEYTPNNATTDQSNRIKAALAEMVQLYNDWQGIRGLTVRCSYNSGVETADCSYGGSMRMGPNASYQRTGTVLHETNHAVGVGTTSMWYNNSNLRTETSRGIWLGERANQMVRFLENDESVSVTGDDTHMWATGGSPLAYGINGAREDTGSPLQYIGNVLITHALGEDGLTPTRSYDNGYPYYSVDVDDGIKYYIKGVTDANGLYTSYVAQGEGNTVVLSAVLNDSAAWYVAFDASAGKYILRNVATGCYLTHTTANFRDVIRANSVTSPGSAQLFQIKPTRHDLTVGDPWNSYTARPVNFFFESWNGMTSDGTTVSPTAVDDSDNATLQQWFFMSERQMQQFQQMVSQFTVDSLIVSGREFQQFNNNRTDYIIGMPADATIDDIQVRAVTNSRFSGEVDIQQADTFPGIAIVTVMPTVGTPTVYTLRFVENLIPTWDGGTATGTASKANRHGWDATGVSNSIWGNANYLNTHYMDPGLGSTAKYTDVTFDGRPYNLNRMLMLAYLTGSEAFFYTATGLQPSTTYDVTLGLGWYTTDADPSPTMTLKATYLLNDSTEQVATSRTVTLADVDHRLTPQRLTFTTPDDITADTPLRIWLECPSKSKIILADLCLSVGDASKFAAEDVNHDGTVDTQDVLGIYQYMQQPADTAESLDVYDVNHDGIVDTQDVLSVYAKMQQ